MNGAKEKYKQGMRIQLDSDMQDDSPHAPKKGECGTVDSVDDMGTVHVHWDNGSSLGVIVSEDSFHVVEV